MSPLAHPEAVHSPFKLRPKLAVGIISVFASFFVCPISIAAHPLAVTETTLTLHDDGTFQVDLITDLDALALSVPQTTDDTKLVAALQALTQAEFEERVDRLRRLFRRRVRVRFDGEPAPFEVTFPDHGAPRADWTEIPTVLGLTARLTSAIPDGSREVAFFASRAFLAVHLTVVDKRRDMTSRFVLERGARSDPFNLVGPVVSLRPGTIVVQYLRLGFTHIIPEGLDHILFVLGLFLLNAKFRPLAWQVTAFTIAHALTLTLATFEAVALSAKLVEPLIALSISYVAFENIITDRLKPSRSAIVFLFGLLHGLGFASVLIQLGLPEGERPLALVSFNIGIEAGQLAVIVAAFTTVGWVSQRPWYRTRIVIPVSFVIGIVGLAWMVQHIVSQ